MGDMDVEDNTRDLAVATSAKMDAHVVDCLEVRKRNEAKLDKIDIKIDVTATEINHKLDKLLWIVLPVLGGLVLASHAVDWILQLHSSR